jgi:hypothetical protein
MSSFIRVLNWEDYQHYKDRSAPWIKLHRDILTSHFWVIGDDDSKLLALCLMLLAQRTDNKIPHDLTYIKRFSQLQQDVNLDPLLSAHFIELYEENDSYQSASNTLATCSPEREGERDIKTYAHFDEFWTAYPKKKNKGDAERAWKKLKVDTDLLNVIISAVEGAKQTEDWKKQGGKFIPYPASWLNAKGWEDEIQVDDQFAGAI